MKKIACEPQPDSSNIQTTTSTILCHACIHKCGVNSDGMERTSLLFDASIHARLVDSGFWRLVYLMHEPQVTHVKLDRKLLKKKKKYGRHWLIFIWQLTQHTM